MGSSCSEPTGDLVIQPSRLVVGVEGQLYEEGLCVGKIQLGENLILMPGGNNLVLLCSVKPFSFLLTASPAILEIMIRFAHLTVIV